MPEKLNVTLSLFMAVCVLTGQAVNTACELCASTYGNWKIGIQKGSLISFLGAERN